MKIYRNYIKNLNQLALEISSADTPQKVTEVVLIYFEKLIAYDAAAIIFFDDLMSSLNICWTRGLNEKIREWILKNIPKHATDLLKIINQKDLKPINWIDVSKIKNIFFNPGQMKSYVWIPVVVHGKPIGVICFSWKHTYKCDKNTMELFSILGNLIGGELQKLQQSFQIIVDQEQKISTLISEIEKNSYFMQTSRSVIGKDPKMQKIYETIMSIVETDAQVLIEGETGTGKEVIAEYIHYLGHRKQGPFIKVNCGALPDNLLESEFFGHVKGSFTGAYKDRLGRFEVARNGTLFLDEVCEMSKNMQVKLLRVLQEGIFERVGDSRPIKTDVRIICATNRDLMDAVRNGEFRKDLYFRLNTIYIKVPPIRECLCDLPAFMNYFIDKFNQKYNTTVEGVSKDLFDKLYTYSWPGNIRELEHLMERAVITTKRGEIDHIDLPDMQYSPSPVMGNFISCSNYLEAKRKLVEDFEKKCISNLLHKNSGSITKSYQEAGLDRKTFYLKMKKYGIKFHV
jgi:transcriptional regulator with GAF, ATPase, and Fis domain